MAKCDGAVRVDPGAGAIWATVMECERHSFDDLDPIGPVQGRGGIKESKYPPHSIWPRG